jgi:hypothetical protein
MEAAANSIFYSSIILPYYSFSAQAFLLSSVKFAPVLQVDRGDGQGKWIRKMGR